MELEYPKKISQEFLKDFTEPTQPKKAERADLDWAWQSANGLLSNTKEP